MKRQLLIAAAVLTSVAALLMLVYLLGPASQSPEVALAAPLALTAAEIGPSQAPNDLDTRVTITGTDFAFTSTVCLGNTSLNDVEWVSATTLMATVPWGMAPGVYTLTVENPGAESASLVNAFTVTQGIGVWTAGKLYGGDVAEVVINPLTPTTIYAVSEDVGMFRSTDGGANWEFKVAGGECSVRNLTIDPISPTVIYMLMPWTLHRSDDGGDTWTPLYAPGDVPYPHPTEPGTIFVSNPTEGESGLWKSEDYGETWLTMTTGLTETRVKNLVFHPTSPLTIYVGTELGNIFVSSDGGASWSFVSKPLDYIQELAINPRGDHELWASNCCFCPPRTTLKSTNVGHTAWITVAEPVGSMSLRRIEFAPDAWGEAYSRTIFVSECWDEIQKSADGGDTWESLDPQSNEWHWGLAVHPTASDIVYASGNRQGVYKTTDGESSWQVANQGLTAVVPEQMATVAGQPDVVYAVTELGLLKGSDGGATWQNLPVGSDTGFVATDPFTPSRVYAAGGDGGGDMPVYISEDGGLTWPTTSYLTEPAQYSECAHLDPIIHPDPSQPGVLLAGIRHSHNVPGGMQAGSLYRSTDAGENWTLIEMGQEISPVADIAFDVVSPSIVYAGTYGGLWDEGSGLFRSTDGGQTWQRIGQDVDALDLSEDIAVEPSAPYRVVIRTGWPNAAIYVSEDHGESWTRVTGVGGDWGALLYTYDTPPGLYAAASDGLFRSADAGQSWSRASGPLAYVPIYSLATVTAPDRVILYVGTTGGYAETGGAQALNLVNDDGTLVNAGVYRYTTRRIWRVYLPLMLRAYTD